MKEAKRTKEVSIKEFYKEFVGHISNTLPEHRRITSTELEVLTEFWMLEGALAEIGRFSTASKRYIREDLFRFKTYSGLENYITKLYKKGYISVDDNGNKCIAKAFDLPKNKIKEDGKFSVSYEYIIK